MMMDMYEEIYHLSRKAKIPFRSAKRF